MKKIMVVDDEIDTVDLIRLVLKTEGFEVIPAYSGKECLEKLKTEKPSLILLDIMMPEMEALGQYSPKPLSLANEVLCHLKPQCSQFF